MSYEVWQSTKKSWTFCQAQTLKMGEVIPIWDYRYLAEKLNESVRIPYS